MRNNRIYYRNPFFHIGHLQTLFFNDQFALSNKGKCYAIVDDRYHQDYKTKIQDDFTYLNLRSTVLVPISDYLNVIQVETKKLISSGRIYMLCGKIVHTSADYINECLDKGLLHFQLKLKDDHTTIVFTKEESPPGTTLSVVYLFEYIIKVLDNVLQITDITSDLVINDKNSISNFTQLSTRKINIIPLKLYNITGFRYIKKQWPTEALYDPCLLTLKGMKSRGIPCKVLMSFYEKAMEEHLVGINTLNELLRQYLVEHALPLRGIIDPLRVDLGEGNAIYMERRDFGMDDPTKLIQQRSCHLLDCVEQITCTQVLVNEKGVYGLVAEQNFNPDRNNALRTIPWLACANATKVRFKCYNWYYTGYNNVMKPVIHDGYIQACDLDPSKSYHLEGRGYCTSIEVEDDLPCFIFLCI
jgi:hypothetical protein